MSDGQKLHAFLEKFSRRLMLIFGLLPEDVGCDMETIAGMEQMGQNPEDEADRLAEKYGCQPLVTGYN